jgi:hypothetical protein
MLYLDLLQDENCKCIYITYFIIAMSDMIPNPLMRVMDHSQWNWGAKSFRQVLYAYGCLYAWKSTVIAMEFKYVYLIGIGSGVAFV